MHAAILAVDDDRIAALRHGDRALDLAHDGNAGGHDGLDDGLAAAATFEFYRFAASFLHEAYRVGDGIGLGSMVGTER